MIKIHLLVRCEHCQGKAYLPTGQAISQSGETYTHYKPCPACQGSGNQAMKVGLVEEKLLLRSGISGLSVMVGKVILGRILFYVSLPMLL